MGYLCRRFSCRAVLLVCPLVASASACICFFANDVLFLVVAFGVVHGTAVSGVYVAVNVLVSQHFEKRRTTACCMIFLMSGLNLIYVPPLTELLRSTYGLRGMLLLLGGIILNACPAVIVLRGPAWMDRPDAPSAGNGVELAKHKTAVGNSHSSAFRDESGTAAEKGHTERCLSNTSLTEVRSVRNGTKHVILCNIHPESAKTTQFSEVDNEGYFSALRPFATVAFAINAASFSVVVFGLTTFFLLHVDMAVDRGVTPARAGASHERLRRRRPPRETRQWRRHRRGTAEPRCGDASGLRDSGLRLRTVRVASKLPAHAGLFGSDRSQQRKDLYTLTRPFLFGYYRDGQGSYNGIFHVVAVLNAALVFVWLVRVILRRRTTKRRTHMATRL
ncbi:hypothetical protein MRX96_038155 [Rhipicephalus microplus]